VKRGAVKGEVVALDGTAIKAYSQRSLDNKTGKSDCEARVGRARRGFTLGYKVHAACCTSSELPLAFTVEPCNRNDKCFIKPLLKKLKRVGISFETVLADAQYDSAKVRNTVREYGAEPVIPYRKTSRIKNGLKIGRDFVVHGVKRLVNLFFCARARVQHLCSLNRERFIDKLEENIEWCFEIEVVLVDSGCSICYYGDIYSCANANWRFSYIPEKGFDAQPVWLLFALLLCTNEHYDMLDDRWDILALWKTSFLLNLFLSSCTHLRTQIALSSPVTDI
jgi:hypothetical protein